MSGCQTVGNTQANFVIDTLLTDSRSLTYPDSTIFFAIKTPHGNGAKYIPQLYEKGVRAFVCTADTDTDTGSMPQATFLISDNPLCVLQEIASHHRGSCTDLTTIGITGSNGKTMLKEWLYQLVGDKQQTVRSPKSYNSQIGVPLSLCLLQKNTRLAIIEAGISRRGEMQKLRDIIRPDVVAITNIGSAHQENFDTLLQKANEKLILATDAKKIVYPADNATLSQAISESIADKNRLCGWTTNPDNKDAFVHVLSVKQNPKDTVVSLKLQDGAELDYNIPFIDSASIQNSITAFTLAVVMGYDPAELCRRMHKLEPVAMRLEVKEGQRNLTLINDSYNSDINSLGIALDFMARRKPADNRGVTLILSDILQSGQNSSDLYHSVAKLINEQPIDMLITVGENLYTYRSLFKIPSQSFTGTEQLLASHCLEELHDSTVLIKGARLFHFDRITAILEKRVHETILEINLNAIVDNLNHYRSMMQPQTKIVCMVKASAYGAGSIEVCKTLRDHNVDFLAVAVADEGVALRQGGIDSRVMIMNPENTSFHDLFQYHLEPEVYNFDLLNALIHAAEKQGVTDFPIHLKLDTGMHRLGFDPQHDIEHLISILHNQKALKPCSIFSHFVGSDSAEFDQFTQEQFSIFDKASKQIQQAFSHRILRHICNSAAIERFPQFHLDMVRLGIGLYGINPFNNHIINTISTLKTTILQIRDVPQTDTVGYSRKGKLTRPSRIAAIPIGYADGLNRHLGRGNGYCLVNGRKASYVGNICMDVCMIDVTDIDCKEGDSVEIFGNNLPVTVLSDILNTIPYEILTSVSERVKKVYFS